MKFGWLDLFASRMSKVPKSSVSGTVSSCLLLWSFLSCHYFFLSCNEVLGNIFHASLYIFPFSDCYS
uniref:Uncharacterized protein n=1 Tax=Populus trichocarpa TaxID=3694 RepID=A0A3N7ELA2_POPTR